MRAFVKLREVMAGHQDLALIDGLGKYKKHGKETIRNLLKPLATGLRRPIGFGA